MKKNNEIDEIVKKYFEDVQEKLTLKGILPDDINDEVAGKIVNRDYEIFKIGFLMANMSFK